MNEDFIWHIAKFTIPEVMSLLPGRMDSLEARGMLLAIGLQESDFHYRHQIKGTARGFWQFETPSTSEVLIHSTTQPIITPICDFLLYPATIAACWPAMEHNDVLAGCFARCLLWTDPRSLPLAMERGKGWAIYIDRWKPGRPHREKWDKVFIQGYAIAKEAA